MRLLLLAAALAAPLLAESDNNLNSWFMYFGDHPIAKSRWGVHLEGQWRRTGGITDWQQFLVRPGLNYQLSRSVSLSGGYLFADTHRYGDYPAIARFPEHRWYEQVQINRRVRGADLQNRFRLEQRRIGVMAPDAAGKYSVSSYRYENRVRHLVRANIPLKVGGGKNYLALYNEVMFNFGRHVERNVFDQNRAYVAWGRDLGHQTRFEMGFMEQTIQRRGGLIFEHNHTLQFAIYSRLPFGD